MQTGNGCRTCAPAQSARTIFLNSLCGLFLWLITGAALVGNGAQQSPVRVYEAARYPSFAAAVDAAQAAGGGALVVTNVQNVAASKTVPADVFLRFEPGGQLDVAAGQTVLIKEPITAGRYQVFTGAGTVAFDGTYPDAWYPEWFGARGDDAHDDWAAFDKINTAARHGAPHVLLANKTYYLSESWELTVPMKVECAGADNWYTPCMLHFAANKRGLVVHALSTKSGKRDADEARFSRLSGFFVKGEIGPPTGTCDVNGLTLTKLTGADFTDGAGYHLGNTITINGYEYFIAGPPDSAVQLKLQPPRLLVLATNGSPYIDNGVQLGTWPLDWQGRQINIGGMTYTIESITSNGGYLNTGHITLNTPFKNLSGPYAATIDALSIKGANMRPNLYHGIELRGHAEVENMQVRLFAGNCISADTSLSPTAYPGAVPNTNNSMLRRNSLYFCKGSGIYTHGVNSNQMTIQNNDATNNNGAGFYEGSFLGNLYLGNHASYNGQGAIVSPQNGVNFSTFVGEYSEGGQPSSVFDQFQLVLNGDHGAGIQPGVQGQVMQIAGWTRHNTIESVQSTPKVIGLRAGDAPNMQPGTLLGFGAAEDTANTGAGGTPTSLRGHIAYQLGYDQLSAGWWSLYYGGNYSVHQANSVLAFSGSAAPEGAGKLWLYRGIDYIGPARDVGLARTAAHTLQITDGAGGRGRLDAAANVADSFNISNGPALVEGLLASVRLDAARANFQTLYTVPNGKTLVITKLIYRAPTANLAALVFQCQNSATATPLVSGALNTLKSPAAYAVQSFNAGDPAVQNLELLASGASLQCRPDRSAGATASVTIDVFGYLY
jgi:hypothetical protein